MVLVVLGTLTFFTVDFIKNLNDKSDASKYVEDTEKIISSKKENKENTEKTNVERIWYEYRIRKYYYS